MSTKISRHFTLTEALYLPQWNREATVSDGLTPEILESLTDLFSRLDTIRDHFASPITVHCAFRPLAYNTLVKGAKKSAHLRGMACDFSVKGISCDDVRKEILALGYLDLLDLRMEDLPGSNWVHIDTAPPGPSGRFFPV